MTVSGIPGRCQKKRSQNRSQTSLSSSTVGCTGQRVGQLLEEISELIKLLFLVCCQTDIDKRLREERKQKIFDMWLACYTQEEIAKVMGIGERTVPNIIESAKGDSWKKLRIFSLYQDPKWKPPIYDVMNGVPLRTVSRWISRKSKDLKAERNRKIAGMWLACYTEEEIAAEVKVDQSTVNRQVQELCKSAIWQKRIIFSLYQDPNWKPPLYDVWKMQNKSDRVSHPGNTEVQWVDNLLYMYTEPFDIVVDPFAGGPGAERNTTGCKIFIPGMLSNLS